MIIPSRFKSRTILVSFILVNITSKQLLAAAICLLVSGCAETIHQDSEKLLLLRHKNRGRYYSPGNKLKYWLRSDNGAIHHKGVLEKVADSSIQVSSESIPMADIWYIKRRWRFELNTKADLDKWKPEVVDFGELVEIVNDY